MESLERKLVSGIFGAALVALIFVFGYEHFETKKEKVAVAAAIQDQKNAAIDRIKAVNYDQQASKDKEIVVEDDASSTVISANITQTDAKVVRLREAISENTNSITTSANSIKSNIAPVDLAPLVDAQAQEIDALKAQHIDDTKRIADRDKLIASITVSRDSWKASADQSASEAIQLHAAMAAKEGLIRAAEIKGFLYGFAFGSAAGGAAVAYINH